MRTSRPVGLPALLAIVLAAASAGAQPAPAPPPADAVPPPGPPAIDVSDPGLAPVPAAPKTLGGWRDALQLLGTRSSELTIAELEVERARGASRQALGRALPSVTAVGRVAHHFVRDTITVQLDDPPGGTWEISVPPTPTARADLSVSQPILAPRVWYAVGTADRSVEAARLSADDRYRTLIAAVANQIVVVVTAERVAEINRVGLRSSLERLELFKRRLALGSGTALDIVRAEQDVTLARSTLISGDEALRQAREALGLALGTSEAYGVPPSISLDEIERSARQSCTPATADTRADVLAARAELDVAERNVTDAKLAYAPSAEIESTASVSTEALVGSKSYAWSIQGILTVPIWDGGSRYGAVRSAKASVLQQKERVESTRRIANLEAGQSLRAIAVAEQARVLAEKGRDLAKETARLSQRAFEAGASTSFELVDAARRQREAELDLAVREFELVQAKIAALLATASCPTKQHR